MVCDLVWKLKDVGVKFVIQVKIMEFECVK
jgi:hypothetical protein